MDIVVLAGAGAVCGELQSGRLDRAGRSRRELHRRDLRACSLISSAAAFPRPMRSPIAMAALVLSMGHFLARPHVLALPVMLAWANGLMSASERGEAPSFWLLPLIALWANLHGGFVFGLVLVGAFALDALWNADRAQRKPLALRWAAFGIGALVACCVTPYGWGSILASRKILDLGELLHLISEWMPADFSKFGAFELTILALIAGALYSGVKLSPPRIALVLGLLHMALSHVRNVEIFALLLPIVVLAPVASQFALQPAWLARAGGSDARDGGGDGRCSAAGPGCSRPTPTFAPPENQSPAAAVDALKAHNPKRVLNDLPFGGYLIWRQMPVFVDGRAELYGEAFDMAFYRAMQLKDVNQFLDMLKKWDIDAVLLTPHTPAVGPARSYRRLAARLCRRQRRAARSYGQLIRVDFHNVRERRDAGSSQGKASKQQFGAPFWPIRAGLAERPNWRRGRDSGTRVEMNLPTEIVEMLGQTIGQGGAGHDRAGAAVLGAGAFLGLQSRQALVAQARARHRHLLLVPGAAVRARVPHRAVGARRRLAVFGIRDADELIAFYDNGHGPLSTLPLWLQAMLFLVAGRFHDVLAAPHVPWRRVLEIPRHPSFVRGCGLDLGGALSPRQPAAGNHRGRRRAADGRHFAERDALARAVQHLPFGVRPRQSELDARPVQIRDGDAGVPPLAPHRAAKRAATPISPAPFRSGTSCSGPSGCRKTGCPTSMAWTIRRRFRARSSGNWPIRSGK